MTRKKLSINEEDEQESAEELADAAADESPTDVTAPELNAKTEELTEWDDAPESHGTAAPKVVPEENDDDTIASKLVYEGTDEAERERRIAAADPDFEP